MKKILFPFLMIALCTFSSASFAQTVTGGAADGLTAIANPEPIAITFTRNNGNGTTGSDAEIRMYYLPAPTVAPILTQIYYNGAPLIANFTPVTGNLTTILAFGYVSFLIPQSNIPPAIKLVLTYKPSPWQPEVSISGLN